jgi:ABC-type glycerol-3-phosphate transport system substrate-binding protein
MKRYLFLMSLSIIVLLTGCEKSTSGVNVLIFSKISPIHEDAIEAELLKMTNHKHKINVKIYPSSREKLAVMLSKREGDVFISTHDHLSQLLNKTGLKPLDQLIYSRNDKEDFYPFMTENQNGERHLYGLPINKHINLFEENEILVNEPLVAILPAFSKKQAEGEEILTLFLD